MALNTETIKCRPAVSNETVLATMQEFILKKVAPIQTISEIALLLDYYWPPVCLFYSTLPFIFS